MHSNKSPCANPTRASSVLLTNQFRRPAHACRLRLLPAAVVAASILFLTVADSSPSSASPPRKKPCAALELANRTDRPIYVYIDGAFIARCNPMGVRTVECPILGNVTGLGRFRCDTWGPEPLNLQADHSTRWVFQPDSCKTAGRD